MTFALKRFQLIKKKLSTKSGQNQRDAIQWESLFKDAHKISLLVHIPNKKVNFTPHPIKPNEVMSCLSNNPNVGKPVTQSLATKSHRGNLGLRALTKSLHVTLQQQSIMEFQKTQIFRDRLL